MSLKLSLAVARAGLTALLFVLPLPGLRAAAVAPVTLVECVKPVAAMPANGVMKPHRGYISRSALKASESAATMTFEVALKMRNFAELETRVNHGDRISPKEMAQKYEPLASDYEAVAAWLKSDGFTIVDQSPQHLALFVSGNVSQIGRSLQVNFARVTSDGVEYTSATTAPSVPAGVAPLLISINGLQPHIRAHRHILKPAAGSGETGYTPAQIALAYQATGLYSSNITGAGQTIAIAIDTFPLKTDLESFWTKYSIAQSINNFTFTQVVGGTLPSPSGEETLDTEWSSAMAPGAKVRVYAARDLEPDDLDAVYARVLSDVQDGIVIHQMSMSYGLGELDAASGQIMTDHEDYFSELAAAGVTLFASSGDDGAYPGEDADGNAELEVEAPASDPSVTGVGGTTLTNPTAPTSSNEIAWNNDIGATGGGVSTVFTAPPWQAVNGVLAGGASLGAMRMVPDIACAGDPDFGADLIMNGSVTILGGTSWASPTCAGFCALINQARANAGLPSLGLLGPYIYPLLGTANFRDIITGPSPVDFYSYPSGPGYDEATGIGVPLVQTLAASLTNPVSVSSFLVTVNQGQSATISVTASGSPVSYQWQVKPVGSTTWSNLGLADASNYSGITTATLTILHPAMTLSGDQFQCVVTYAGSVAVTSPRPTTLIVELPWSVTTLAGTPGTSGLTNTSGASARFDYPTGVVADGLGNLYVTDLDNAVIRKVAILGGSVTSPVLTETGGKTNAPGTNDIFTDPRDITIDGSGNLYVSDEGTNLILKITVSTGAVTTFAGTTSTTSPIFSGPKGIAVDHSGNVYVVDSGNNVIRKITSGTVTTYAGASTFTAGYKDGAATQALFNQPIGLAIDSAGNLYVGDYSNQVIRKIGLNGSGVLTVSTFAGQAGVPGCVDGLATTQALFNTPRGMTVDGAGNIYVTDSAAPLQSQLSPSYTGNDLLRKISPAGVVTTLAGQAGIAGTANNVGSVAQFYSPTGIAMDTNGILYIADASNNAIREAMPGVSASATIPYAWGLVGAPGQVTVTRIGSTLSALTLTYSTTGSTAVAGTDYTALPGSVIIPAGASSATITVSPLDNPQATTNRTVQLTFSGSMVATSPVTVTLLGATPLSFSTWQSNHPDPTPPLSDGVTDFEKYAFDLNPSAPLTATERAALPILDMTTGGSTSSYTLTYRLLATLSGTATAQMSPDLQNWTPAPAPTILGLDPATQDPILQVTVPNTGASVFLRLKLTP